METSAASKCLERLGITLSQLQQEPGFFLNRVHPGDRAKFTRRLRDCALDTELNVTLYDENSRARKDRVTLGTFLEYVDEETSSLRVGLVVSCLKSRVAAAGTQSQDMLLVVELPGESSETAKMPAPDAMSRIIPTSAITCKIDVEQRGPAAPVQQQSAPFQPQPIAQQQQQQPQQEQQAFLPPIQPRAAPSAILQNLADRNGAFVCAIGSSFYGLEPEGTLPIGSYVSPMLSVARSNSTNEMFATTDTGRLLSVELEQGRVRELGPTLLGQQQIRVHALCFAEGKPAAMPVSAPGAFQMYAIAKDVPTLNGDCLITVNPSGKCELVFELGRKDITALACVPITLDFTRERNAWYSIGPSDANPNAMRFVLWTERGGLFVIDDARRSLQQLGGELVQSLEISSICFDSAGDLFAAGSKSLYLVGPAGRVVEVAPLQHLPGRVAGICYVPRTLLHPQPAAMQEHEEEEEPVQEYEEEGEPRAREPRKKSWWKLTTGGGETLLRLFRPNKSKTPASAAAPAVEAPKPDTKRTSVNKQQQAASPPRTTASNRTSVQQQQQPMYDNNAPSFLNESYNNSSFTGQPPPLQQASFYQQPLPPQQRATSQRQHTGPYYPTEPTMAPPPQPAPMYAPSYVQHQSQPSYIQHQSQPAPPMYAASTYTQQQQQPSMMATHNHSHISNSSFVAAAPPSTLPPPSTAARAPSLPPPPTTARAQPQQQQQRPVSAPPPQRPKDVPTLLHTLGLTQYVADFRREELLDINLVISMYTNDRDFKEILKDVGVAKLGHREIIAHAIRQYQQPH